MVGGDIFALNDHRPLSGRDAIHASRCRMLVLIKLIQTSAAGNGNSVPYADLATRFGVDLKTTHRQRDIAVDACDA